MGVEKNSFDGSQYTGGYFAIESVDDIGTGSRIIRHTLSMVFLAVGFSTGANHFSNYYLGEPEKDTATVSQIRQNVLYHDLSTIDAEIVSVKAKLTKLRKTMGLNILDIATILGISRPTVYNWLEADELKLHKKHKDRLNAIYHVCTVWEDKKVGHLGSYLHKAIAGKKESFFDVLAKKQLNEEVVNEYIEKISQLILIKRKREQEHDALLATHGFEPVSKEERDARLDDILLARSSAIRF